jgi:hypothetical protein
MKPWPTHHKRVSVPRSFVACGYGGERSISMAGPGKWIIVERLPNPAPGTMPHLPRDYVLLRVAPARGGK